MEFGDRPPDPGLPHYKTLKTSLASVLKVPEKQQVISQAAATMNGIVIRGLLLLRLFLIHRIGTPPAVDTVLVETCLKVVCVRKATGRPPTTGRALRDELTTFYTQHFEPLLPEGDQQPSYTHLNTVLAYAAVQVVAAFETNVKEHFVEYVEAYVNALWHKDYLVQRIRATRKTKRDREAGVRKLCTTLRQLKNDLLGVGSEPLQSHPSYHAWVRQHRAVVLPAKQRYEKDLLKYDLQCAPQDYWPGMLRMTRAMEQTGKKIRNFCPLRTSVIPRHICLDTTVLVHLLFTEANGPKEKMLRKGELVRNKDKIWSLFFRTDQRAFSAKDYRFNNMVYTDGVACSILLIRRDLYGKKCSKGKPAVVASERYIDDLSSDEKARLRIRTVVGIDPNMSDLLYCVDENASKHYRYTQNQRRRETKAKKYRDIVLKERTHTRIQNRTVAEWESDLSAYNHKQVDSAGFKAYVRAKLLVNSKVTAFYEERVYRKLRLNTFYNIRKSEQRLTQRFKEVFGTPDEVVIGIGDWEQSKHRKYKEPTKGKGFRSLLRRAGYPVFLVDEFRTSCQCSHCQSEGGKCEKFRVRMDPHRNRAIEERRLRLVHGLLACKTCGRLWNRDVNSSINIARLTRQAVETQGRPAYLSRQSTPPEADSAVASTAQNEN